MYSIALRSYTFNPNHLQVAFYFCYLAILYKSGVKEFITSNDCPDEIRIDGGTITICQDENCLRYDMWDFNGFPYLQYTPVDYWDVFPLSGMAYFESSVSPFSATRLMLGNYNVHASSRSDWILSDTKVNYMCVWGTAGKTE